ncbi:MAG: hypothetical protein AAFR24_11020 [Cyanobacteria bacterium J06627_3]
MILGGPGSGKGTQSNTPRLEYYDYRQRLLRVDGNQTSDDVKRAGYSVGHWISLGGNLGGPTQDE